MPQMTPAQARAADPILTSIVRGYTNAELIGTRLLPRVTVEASGGKVIQFGEDDFVVYDTTHAPGHRVGQSDYSYGTQSYQLVDHAHDVVVPRRIREDAQAVPRIDVLRGAARRAMRILARRLEWDIAQLVTNPANYPATNKTTLSGTSQWSDYANSDPIQAITDARKAVALQIAVEPNTLVLGYEVYAKLVNHPKITARMAGSQLAVVTEEVLARVFNIPNVLIGRAIYKDLSGNKAPMWGKNAILAYVNTAPDPEVEDPSFGYTYTLRGYPFAEEAYWSHERRSWFQGAADCRAPVIAGPVAGYLFSAAVA